MRVVVLSSSEMVRDIDLAYKLGANSYLIKPLDFERFVEISLALHGYWLWLDKRPEEDGEVFSPRAPQAESSITSVSQMGGRKPSRTARVSEL